VLRGIGQGEDGYCWREEEQEHVGYEVVLGGGA